MFNMERKMISFEKVENTPIPIFDSHYNSREVGARKMVEPLKNITLTMIVRDELMNHAGGLHAVLSHHLPYFEEVVVLDTGSIDGTRQLLEQMRSEHPQLRVYDAEFTGYGPARNKANEYVNTKYTFMLDADEMLEKPEQLASRLKGFLGRALHFRMINVYPNGILEESTQGWNPRLFQPSDLTFNYLVYELPCFGNLSLNEICSAPVPFLHFTRFKEQRQKKEKDWYDHFYGTTMRPPDFPPFKAVSFHLWKTPSPAVLENYGIDVLGEVKYLESLGLRLHPKIAEQLSLTKQLSQPP